MTRRWSEAFLGMRDLCSCVGCQIDIMLFHVSVVQYFTEVCAFDLFLFCFKKKKVPLLEYGKFSALKRFLFIYV